MSVAELCAELAELGLTRGFHSKKRPDVPSRDLARAQLQGMVYRERTRQDAIDGGAAPCSKHEGEYEGDCPRCRGLWPPETSLSRPDGHARIFS